MYKKLIAEPIKLANCKLKNFYRIGEGIYRSDQPSHICFLALEKFGIREVLNLRNYHTDTAEARGTQIRLHHIRTRASQLDPAALHQAMRIIYERKGPLLFHCWHGSDRTGAVAAAYRIIFQGVSKEQAIDEMVEGKFGFHMTFDSIIPIIHHMDVRQIRQELFSAPHPLSETAP